MTEWKTISPWKPDWRPSAPGERPPVDDSRPRLSDADAAAVAAYLDVGQFVMRTTKLHPDPLSDSDTPVVPSSLLTDGEWIWNDSLTYFVKTYHIAPREEFLAYLQARQFQPRDPAHIDVAGALAFIRR